MGHGLVTEPLNKLHLLPITQAVAAGEVNAIGKAMAQMKTVEDLQ
jgi:hypothetical protein